MIKGCHVARRARRLARGKTTLSAVDVFACGGTRPVRLFRWLLRHGWKKSLTHFALEKK